MSSSTSATSGKAASAGVAAGRRRSSKRPAAATSEAEAAAAPLLPAVVLSSSSTTASAVAATTTARNKKRAKTSSSGGSGAIIAGAGSSRGAIVGSSAPVSSAAAGTTAAAVGGPASAEKKEQQDEEPSPPVVVGETNKEQLRQRFLNLFSEPQFVAASSNGDGTTTATVSNTVLKERFGTSYIQLVDVINELTQQSKLTMSKSTTSTSNNGSTVVELYYTLLSDETASKFAGLDVTHKLVYQVIEKANNNGIWTKGKNRMTRERVIESVCRCHPNDFLLPYVVPAVEILCYMFKRHSIANEHPTAGA